MKEYPSFCIAAKDSQDRQARAVSGLTCARKLPINQSHTDFTQGLTRAKTGP